MPKPPALLGDIVSVRYIVTDVEAALRFYTGLLDFKLEMHPDPAFAILSKGNLRLLLNRPQVGRGGSREMPDGAAQVPGGWNRIQVEVKDLESTVAALERKGATFRNRMIVGVSGNKQILLQDPSGNLVELVQY